MTAPAVDFSEITPTPIPEGVPNHHATREPSKGLFSSGQSGEPRNARPGIFGRTGKRANAAPQAATKRAPVPKLSPSMRQNLEDLYSGIGAMVRPFDEYLGDTIIEQAPKCAKSVYALAQSNESVRRFIIGLTTTTVTGAVIFAHLPILLALMRHTKNEKVKMGVLTTALGIKAMDTEKMFDGLGEDDETADE